MADKGQYTYHQPSGPWLAYYGDSHPKCDRCGKPAVAVVSGYMPRAGMYQTEALCQPCMDSRPTDDLRAVAYRRA